MKHPSYDHPCYEPLVMTVSYEYPSYKSNRKWNYYFFLVLYLYEAKHRPIALFFKSYGRASYKYEVTKQIVLSHYVFSDICPKPDDFR